MSLVFQQKTGRFENKKAMHDKFKQKSEKILKLTLQWTNLNLFMLKVPQVS